MCMALDLAFHAIWIFEGSLKKGSIQDHFAASHELRVCAREVTSRRHLIFYIDIVNTIRIKLESFEIFEDHVKFWQRV